MSDVLYTLNFLCKILVDKLIDTLYNKQIFGIPLMVKTREGTKRRDDYLCLTYFKLIISYAKY
jgi:hypothetical protein